MCGGGSRPRSSRCDKGGDRTVIREWKEGEVKRLCSAKCVSGGSHNTGKGCRRQTKMVNECERMPVIAAVSKAGRATGVQEQIGLKVLEVRLRMTGAEKWNETCLLLRTLPLSSSSARWCGCEVQGGARRECGGGVVFTK